MLLFRQTAQNIVKLSITCHVRRGLLMAQECESSPQPGCKRSGFIAQNLSNNFIKSPFHCDIFFSPINQREEIYQWTVVRDR